MKMEIEKYQQVLLTRFLTYLKNKGETYVEANRLPIFQVLHLLRNNDFYLFLFRIREVVETRGKTPQFGEIINNEELECYLQAVNKLGMDEVGGLDVEIKLFCESNKLPTRLYSRFIKDIFETNGNIVEAFDLFVSYKQSNANQYLESDQYNCILHFPTHRTDTLKLEIFQNTTPQNIRDFIMENQAVIKRWQKKTDCYKAPGKDSGGEVFSFMPDYPWEKTPKAGMYRQVVVWLSIIQDTDNYKVIEDLFGDITKLSDEQLREADGHLQAIKKLRQKLKKSVPFPIKP